MNGLKLRNGRVYCDMCNQSFLDEAACEPFLKDGETVTECIKRNRKDVDMVLRLLAEEKASVQKLTEALTRLRGCALSVEGDLSDPHDERDTDLEWLLRMVLNITSKALTEKPR